MCGNEGRCSRSSSHSGWGGSGIEGDPSNPISKGKLCACGQSAIYNLYNPYRVLAPMKRTNPKKGLDQDPGWVEISWEEALSSCRTLAQDPCRKIPPSLPTCGALAVIGGLCSMGGVSTSLRHAQPAALPRCALSGALWLLACPGLDAG